MIISNEQYWEEIRHLVKYFSDDDPKGDGWASDYGEDTDKQDAMHEVLDGHEFVIYNAKALAVLQHSRNHNAYQEQIGELPKADDFLSMCPPMAYMAMRQDVSDMM